MFFWIKVENFRPRKITTERKFVGDRFSIGVESIKKVQGKQIQVCNFSSTFNIDGFGWIEWKRGFWLFGEAHWLNVISFDQDTMCSMMCCLCLCHPSKKYCYTFLHIALSCCFWETPSGSGRYSSESRLNFSSSVQKVV